MGRIKNWFSKMANKLRGNRNMVKAALPPTSVTKTVEWIPPHKRKGWHQNTQRVRCMKCGGHNGGKTTMRCNQCGGFRFHPNLST